MYNDDTKIIDLDIQNYKDGIIKNNVNSNKLEVFSCDLIHIDESKYEYLQIPKKRVCTFKLMKHTDSGFQNGKWKDINTRLNQIQYNKKISVSGINDLEYTIINKLDNQILVSL